MNRSKNPMTRADLVFLAACVLILILHIAKAPIGMGESDEHFYITLGYRLAQGDAMFFDDWHIAQMIGIFIYPLVSLFQAMTGGTAGIVLGFRYFYIAFNLLTGICIYLRFRKYSYGAAAAACTFMLFAPYNMFALSYNSMGPAFLLLAALLYPLDSESPVRLFFSGLLYAWSVLNTPYLAAVFAVLTVLAVIRPKLFSRRRWIFMFLGIACAALIFIGFVLSRASLSEIVSCLKYLIDPSHSAGMLKQFVISMGKLVVAFGAVFLLMLCSLAGLFFVKNKEETIKMKFLSASALCTALCVIYICFLMPYQKEMGGYMLGLVPVALFGFEYLLLIPAANEIRLCFALSILNSFAISLSSNVGPRAFSAPLITACAMTMILLYQSSFSPSLKTPMIFGFLAVLLWFNMSFVYMGEGNYSKRIENGPLAGLKDSPEAVSIYDSLLEDIETINAMEDCSFANLITANSWEYLALEKRIAANSTYAYFWEQDQYTDAMDQYRIVHPERYPAYVYLDREGNRYGMKESDPWLSQFTVIQPMKGGTLYLAE